MPRDRVSRPCIGHVVRIGRTIRPCGSMLGTFARSSRPLVLMDAVRYGRDEVVVVVVAASSHRARVAAVVG